MDPQTPFCFTMVSPIFARLRRVRKCSNMIAGVYKPLLYQDVLSVWSVVAFSSPSILVSRYISLTRPVERVFDACTRPVQRLHIYPERFQGSQQVDMIASTTVFLVFAGIGLFISVVPLYWHLKARNVGTCMFMIWAALGCLVGFVNSIVWTGNTVNWAPAWCDFGTYIYPSAQSLPLINFYVAIRIELAVTVAFPACTLCIIRHLYHIASSTAVRTTKSEVGRRIRLSVAHGR